MLPVQYMEVFMADESRTSINISATIPSKVFHAQPRDPNFGKDEVMTFNAVAGELSSLRATYDVRHTDGSVSAYIEGGPASLFNGVNAIPLTTTFNGVTLTESPQEVVDDVSSAPGARADLVITAAKPSDTQNGLYAANFTVVFDAVPRVMTEITVNTLISRADGLDLSNDVAIDGSATLEVKYL
ncbi:adhesin [Pseudomonas brassicacearum]|uniref:Adhesin n=1 Tax=Pseudomonas brassicacearum TaxID=930166 RepID=A0A423H0B5_9PSED|nr:CS1 type fimbrial major subunit [Pseudomonas brassicacearum]RON05175.1 adhesin [Pseudomonas brassicacearum]